MTFRDILDRLSAALGVAGVAIAGLALACMVGIVMTEIVMRNVFSSSTHVSEVIQGWCVALITFGAMSWTFRKGGMIRAVTLSARLSRRLRLWLELALTLLVLVTMGIFAWFVWEDFTRNLARGTVIDGVIRMPQWVSALVVFVSTVMLLLQLLVQVLDLAAGRWHEDAAVAEY